MDRAADRRGHPRPPCCPAGERARCVDWYGLALDDRQFRALGEHLTAFVGPSYTTFRGQRARLDPGNPIDVAVDELTGGRAYKFRGDEAADEPAKLVWPLLERMRSVLDRRGERGGAAPEAIGRVLRHFYMAIRGRDEREAEARLAQVREGFHVDGVNLLFLGVQRLAAFGRWQEILDLPAFPDLLRLRRPAMVTDALDPRRLPHPPGQI